MPDVSVHFARDRLIHHVCLFPSNQEFLWALISVTNLVEVGSFETKIQITHLLVLLHLRKSKP